MAGRTSLALCAAVLLAAPVGGAEQTVHRWIDANGVVNFSDRPRGDAAEVQLQTAPAVDLQVPRAATDAVAGRDEGQGAAAQDDYRVAITNLRDDAVVWNDARRLPLSFDIRPPLGSRPGLRLEIHVDGARRAVLQGGERAVLQDIDRGTHRIQAVLVNADGRRLAASEMLTVHHKQHSVQRPAREAGLEADTLPGGVEPPQGTRP